MNVIIGLTGPTGAGKSSVAKLCDSFGLRHVDCDLVARKAVEGGSEGLSALVEVFGKEILNPDATLNRKALAKIAFSSPESTELLNTTIFPFIKKLVLEETKSGKILLDAPTLFESGIDSICLKTVAVLSDREVRLERIKSRDALSDEEALLRLNAGKSDNFYLENADYIIYNNKTEREFLYRIAKVLSEILQQGENL